MKPRVAEAYVLRTWKLGEADLLVAFFTREEGKLRGVAPSARRSRKRFGGALEPLTRVQVSFVEREGRDLARIRDLEVRRSFFEAQADPVVAAVCGYVAEMADEFGREKEEDERFFRLLGTVLEGLASGVDPVLAARYFEVWTLRLQGLLPDLRTCPSCNRTLLGGGARFDRQRGELSCRSCTPPGGGCVAVSPGALRLAGEILGKPLAVVGEQAHSPRDTGRLARLVAAILERFLERPFRSLKLLEELTR